MRWTKILPDQSNLPEEDGSECCIRVTYPAQNYSICIITRSISLEKSFFQQSHINAEITHFFKLDEPIEHEEIEPGSNVIKLFKLK